MGVCVVCGESVPGKFELYFERVQHAVWGGIGSGDGIME
jgi:DNA-directed RNA polymerase subunit N (RpoN/RPB10)